MKKILIQLDSDKFASTFDSIVAYDAGADVVQSYGGVAPRDIRGLILSAFFTRGIPDLKSLAAWIGGSDVDVGELLLKEARNAFFGPFKISLMLDSNGCNTTASTAIAKLAGQTDLRGKEALVVGPGPVGMRAAVLLAGEGCRVQITSVPSRLLRERFDEGLAGRTLESSRKAAEEFRAGSYASAGGSIHVDEIASLAELEGILDKPEILVAAGPAGVRMLPRSSWVNKPSLKWLIDFNLTEPLGIEGIKPADDFAVYNGRRVLGALAIGNPKMKIQKACIEKLFERNDLILDTEGVYAIAKELI
ncbi:MAG: methylenetetrahydrofolate dehydrogenase [Acidobacteria bacterium]|nr:methylenetetrahydrofolate dehydrogenase [Acidobacteriota bacterium]